jgi:hypothetical protein
MAGGKKDKKILRIIYGGSLVILILSVFQFPHSLGMFLNHQVKAGNSPFLSNKDIPLFLPSLHSFSSTFPSD